MPGTDVTASPVIDEARRAFEICNACRYCEGFCAVFPAMERRQAFLDGDLNYLANLCHGCRGCYYACQYAPPHEFGLNLPRTLAELRTETYAAYAWPRPLAKAFDRNGVVVSAVTAILITVVLLCTMLLQSVDVLYGPHVGEGAFYQVIPWGVIAFLAAGSVLFALVALSFGVVNFWRDTGGGPTGGITSFNRALHDALTLRNLGGGGGGCNDRDGGFSQTRRRLHHALFYGFLACFASTCVATLYADGFGIDAPYDFFSVPVLLGLVGGLAMSLGLVGLIVLKVVGDREPTAPRLLGGEYALLFLLLLTALSGLLLLAFRATGAMGTMLAVHFGIVLAFFVLVPYSRLVHGVYRLAALLRNAAEARNHGD